MKQYKQRQTGAIATLTEQHYVYTVNYNGYISIIAAELIERTSDWEEIIEKKPIFITSDNVSVFEGDTYYICFITDEGKSAFIRYTYANNTCGCGNDKSLMYFSTKILAQEFCDKYNKRVIFTTSDGVDKYIGDDWWHVYSNFKLHKFTISEFGGRCSDTARSFSTEEKANEYILMNKPLLSIKDIQIHITGTTEGALITRVKTLAKSKL